MPVPRGLEIVTLPPASGYGDAASQYVAGLHRLGVPLRWVPTVGLGEDGPSAGQIRRNLQDGLAEDLMPLLWRPLDCSAMLIDVPPPKAHVQWRAARPDLDAYAYVAWEVEQVPPAWLPALDPFDRIFVPSEFNRRALEAAGLSPPVDVVPHAARPLPPAGPGTEAGPGGDPDGGPGEATKGGPAFGDVTEEDFVFYSIGSWTTRKAMEETIRAYLETFTAKDRVALVVKTDVFDHIECYRMKAEKRRNAPPHEGMVWWTVARILAQYPNPAKLHLIADIVPAATIDRLHARGDCFVSLTHSEGWGLGPFDAALHGNPPIVTGWGGQVDYLGADHPFLVRHRMEATTNSPPDDYFMRDPGTYWARADRRHAGELMRYAYEHPAEARAIGARLQARLRDAYAPGRICRRLAGLMGYGTGP